LNEALSDEVPDIEIQIGQDRNRYSLILEHGNIAFRDSVRNRLNSTHGSTFIIGWRFGVVMVFVKGAQFPFMVHYVGEGFEVNFFGLRTL
jgi:hypothetical protein